MVIGSFYFQLTRNGNLVGEFVNQESQRAATESADRRSGDIDRFVGEFQSTWFDGEGVNMTLRITAKGENLLNIFQVIWFNNNGTHFVGEGFLVENMLIGVYADGELNTRIENRLSQ